MQVPWAKPKSSSVGRVTRGRVAGAYPGSVLLDCHPFDDTHDMRSSKRVRIRWDQREGEEGDEGKNERDEREYISFLPSSCTRVTQNIPSSLERGSRMVGSILQNLGQIGVVVLSGGLVTSRSPDPENVPVFRRRYHEIGWSDSGSGRMSGIRRWGFALAGIRAGLTLAGICAGLALAGTGAGLAVLVWRESAEPLLIQFGGNLKGK